MRDETKAYMDNLAERVCEDWETFGAPRDMDEARREIAFHSRDEVMRWTDDVVEVYRAELSDEGAEVEADPVRFGVCLEVWVEAQLTNALARMRALPLNGSPGTCPECGSDSIEGDGVEIDGDFAYQPCHCNECGHEWTDAYRFAGRVPDVA